MEDQTVCLDLLDELIGIVSDSIFIESIVQSRTALVIFQDISVLLPFRDTLRPELLQLHRRVVGYRCLYREGLHAIGLRGIPEDNGAAVAFAEEADVQAVYPGIPFETSDGRSQVVDALRHGDLGGL